jgi:hypothetical protein
MVQSFDPGALLGASYQLEDGTRVRLRLVAASDFERVRRLLEQAGHDGEADLRAARLTRFDPRRRLVVCASALIDRSEELIGVGAIDLDQAPVFAPDTLVVAAEFIPAVRELLSGALVGRAQALARRRAA